MARHVCAEHVPIFNHLDHESLERISDIMVHCKYKKGEIIFSPETSGDLFILARGKVKVYQITTSGREQLLRVVDQGGVLGENNLFDNRHQSTFGEALTDIEVCMMKKDRFMDLLMKYPSISLKLLEEYSNRLRDAEEQMTRTVNEPVSVRLASYLKDLSVAEGSNSFKLPMSMKELADFISTTPETLSRRFHQLEEEGSIKRKGKEVTILNTHS